MRNCFAYAAAVCLLVAVGTVDAQVRVVGHGGEKTRIDWTNFAPEGSPAAREFHTTLKNDLLRSGYFLQSPKGQGEVTLSGRCVQQGGSLRAECTVVGSITQKVYMNNAITGQASRPRLLAHQVSDAIVKAVTGKEGMASARVVMVGTRSGKKELYLAGSDGSELLQLTKDKSISVGPEWGPDNRIAYTSYIKAYPDIYVIDVESGRRNRVSSYAGLNTGADISPDGREMALILSKDGNPELYVKNLQSGRLTRITKTRKAAEASPSWSPDGSEIVYVSDQPGRPQIYVVSRNGGRPRRLTSRGSENVAPDWGKNGKIAYCTRLGGRYQVAVIDPSTRESTILAPPDNGDYEDPSWAPDGRHLACTRTVNYEAKVYILDTLGDPPIALTDYSGDWYSPSWSP